jgi:hypothetical protein
MVRDHLLFWRARHDGLRYSGEVGLNWGNFHDGEPSAACS